VSEHNPVRSIFQMQMEQIRLRDIELHHFIGGPVMLSRRTVLDLLAFCAFVTAADPEPAKKKQESGKKHQHKNGHNLLGAKVRQNGRTRLTQQVRPRSQRGQQRQSDGMSASHPQKGTCRRAK